MNEGFEKAIRKDALYDKLSNKGYALSKDDLMTLCKELAFRYKGDEQEREELIEDLRERGFFEEE